MIFTILGPFEIPRTKNKTIIDNDKNVLKEFWEGIEKVNPGLNLACGCYLFSVKKKNIKPWYIGKATKRSFMKECLGTYQVNLYNKPISKKTGIPMLFFLPRKTKKDKYSKISKNEQKDINWLESFLISICIRKNKKLLNFQKTKYLRDMVVPGILNTPIGRNRKPVKCIKKLLF